MLREERDSLSSEQSLVQIHAAPARFDAIRTRLGRLEQNSVAVRASVESIGSMQIDAVPGVVWVLAIARCRAISAAL